MHQKMSFGELPQEKGSYREDRFQVAESASGAKDKVAAMGAAESRKLRQPDREMKVCPVCGARSFADMDTCFNCLHAFSQDDCMVEKAEGKRQLKQEAENVQHGFGKDGIASSGNGDEPFGKQMEPDAYEAEAPISLDPLPALARGGCGCESLAKSEDVVSSADLGKSIEIVVSISLPSGVCSNGGAASPVVRVETR